jgi:hypothetical protein
MLIIIMINLVKKTLNNNMQNRTQTKNTSRHYTLVIRLEKMNYLQIKEGYF